MADIKSPYVKPNRVGRFSELEIAALKVFKDNDDALKLIRKVFYQKELETPEKAQLQGIFATNTFLLGVLRKLFQPSLDFTEPIFEMGSRWIDRKFSDLLASEVKVLVEARQNDINFQENGLKRLENIAVGDFSPLELTLDLYMTQDYTQQPPEEVKRSAVATQDAITFLESCLFQIKSLANREEITPEQQEEKDKKDSTR